MVSLLMTLSDVESRGQRGLVLGMDLFMNVHTQFDVVTHVERDMFVGDQSCPNSSVGAPCSHISGPPYI